MFRLARCALCSNPIKRLANGANCFIQNSPYHSLFVQPSLTGVPELTTTKILQIFADEIVEACEYTDEGLKRIAQRREALMKLLPTPDDVLPPRRMEDSFVSAIIPFKTDLELRERYVAADGNLRIGRLMEDMDVFSVYCCFKHIKNPKSEGYRNPYFVVTALVDCIHITNDYLNPEEDVRLSGHVSNVGNSSMEIVLMVDQKDAKGVYQKCFKAVFVTVARNPLNTSSVRVNPLVAETPEEKAYMEKCAQRQHIRKLHEAEDIFKKPPTAEERQLIHDRFIERLKNPAHISRPNTKLMRDSGLSSVMICQPEHRNLYNKIFGGFIMRQALELALINSRVYCKRRPRLLNIDDITFQLPVEIGSLLQFRSQVGYVEDDFVHTVVHAEMIDALREKVYRSNELHISFFVPRSDGDVPVPQLEYETYEEAIFYLNARRHFKRMIEDFGDGKLGNLRKE